MAATSLADVYASIAADNRRLRHRFVAQVPHRAANSADDRREVETWLAEGQIFEVSHDGQTLIPAFQFEAGIPRPVIASVLRELSGMTPWQQAFWFVSSCPALDGAAPVDRLDDPAAVVSAAREANGWIG